MTESCDFILRDLPDDLYEESHKKSVIDAMQSMARSKASRDKLNEFRKEIEDSLNKSLNASTKSRYIDIIRKTEGVEFSSQYSNKQRGLVTFLVGTYSKAKDAGSSVASVIRGYKTKFQSRLITGLKRDGVWDYFNDKNNHSAIAKALFKLEDSTDESAKKCARVIKSIYKDQIAMLNARGAEIQALEDFISHQSHNVSKMVQVAKNVSDRISIANQVRKEVGVRNIRKFQQRMSDLAYQRWSNFIKPLIDVNRSFGADVSTKQMDSILRNIYTNIIKGHPVEDELVFRGTGSLGARLGKHRIIHFKDSASVEAYAKEYGYGNIMNSVISTIDKNSQNLGILERLGTRPRVVYESIKNDLIKLSDDPKIVQKMTRADKYFKQIMGDNDRPVNHTAANLMSSLRHITAMGKLGMVVLRSIPDMANELSTLRSGGIGLLDSYKSLFEQLPYLIGTKYWKEDARDLCDSLGILAQSTLGHFHSKFVGLDDPGGKLTKAMGIYFKLNLQHYWDQSLRMGTASALARNLGNMRDIPFEELNYNTQHSLRRYGMEQKEWDLIRSNREAMKTFKGKMVVAPDMVDDFSDESIKKYLGKRKITAEDAQRVKDDMELRLRMYFEDMTDTAQMAPQAAEQAMLNQGYQRGTFAGEIARSFFMFKGYSINIARRTIGRLITQNTNEGIIQSLGSQSTRGLIEYAINATIFGYISNAAYDFVKTGTIPDPTKPKTAIDAWVAGGGLGIFGDYLFHNYNQYGQSLLDMAGGPMADQADQLTKLISTLVDTSDDGHRLSYHQRATKQLIQFSNGLNPLHNLLIAGKAFQYLLNHSVMEKIDPGYVERHNNLIKKENEDNIPLVG